MEPSKIVVRYQSGKILKGYTQNFSPTSRCSMETSWMRPVRARDASPYFTTSDRKNRLA